MLPLVHMTLETVSMNVDRDSKLSPAGAKLAREVFFTLWKYSSLVPGNGARKRAASVWLTWKQTVLVRGE
jgi:hypothetical protein